MSIHRIVALSLSLVMALAACAGEEGRSLESVSAEPTTPSECVRHCEFLQACGATPASEDCASLCAALTDVPAYSAPCRGCIRDQCDRVAACVSDDAVCGAPSVSVTATLDGLTGDAEAHMALTLWDGTPTGVAASKGATASGVTVMTLGHAAKPGVSYRVAYYIDTDEDGVCNAVADVTGAGPLYIKAPDALVYWLGGDVERADTCDLFPSKGALCEARCAEAARCGASSADCGAACAEAPTRTVRACMACQAGRTCDEQTSACYQAGGACEQGYTPPTVQLILGPDGSFFAPDDVGKLVRAKVRNAAGRVLAEAPPIASREAGFVINFGEEVLWENQSYTASFFLDRNEDGACNGDDPVYDTIVEVGSGVVMIYVLLTQEKITSGTCATYDAP